MQIMDQMEFTRFYNDGKNGTGTGDEMALRERGILANEGIVVVSLDIHRPPNLTDLLTHKDLNYKPLLRAKIKVTLRGMWTDNGKFAENMCEVVRMAVSECSFEASRGAIEWIIQGVVRKAAR